MARSDTTTERVEFGSRTSMYPYAALRCPTYRENSHANHTWHQHPQETACFIVPAVPSPWVRFPSPAPFFVAWRVPALPRGNLRNGPLRVRE